MKARPVGQTDAGSRLGPNALLEHVRCEVAAFARCLDHDPTAPVRACPGWDVAELATHLGRVHRWATAALSSGDPPDLPARPSGEDLRTWFDEGAVDLLAELGARDPAQPCWTLAAPHTVGFWVRRQAHESAMHRWDAETALGRPASIDAGLAGDGVDEVVEMMYPRQVALGRADAVDAALVLRAGSHEWVVGGEGPRAAIAADPGELLLLLWKRRTLDEVLARGGRLEGDRSAAETVLGAKLTP